jgi:Carbohydrate binding domain (family 11)
MTTIQAYQSGLSCVRAANPDVRLSIGGDPELRDETVLVVEYPASTGKPAERDVWCDAATQDWSSGRAISFRIKPDQPTRLSVSFMDGNRVAYTAWSDLDADQWQTVEIPFSQIEPNPYFQPPGANRDAPLDVSKVERIGFAPQTKPAGRLVISRFVIVE